MDLLQLFLGQIPEAIFFAWFMIFTKGLKEKRILFTILMLVEYLVFKYAFPFDWMFHIFFMIGTFTTLKLLYKKKSQITDLFILLIGYVVMVLSSAVCFIASHGNVVLATIINRFIIFVPLFTLNYRLFAIQTMYKVQWNRGNPKAKLKSATFRSLNLVIFNVLFVIFNLGMGYAVSYNLLRGGVC